MNNSAIKSFANNSGLTCLLKNNEIKCSDTNGNTNILSNSTAKQISLINSTVYLLNNESKIKKVKITDNFTTAAEVEVTTTPNTTVTKISTTMNENQPVVCVTDKNNKVLCGLDINDNINLTSGNISGTDVAINADTLIVNNDKKIKYGNYTIGDNNNIIFPSTFNQINFDAKTITTDDTNLCMLDKDDKVNCLKLEENPKNYKLSTNNNYSHISANNKELSLVNVGSVPTQTTQAPVTASATTTPATTTPATTISATTAPAKTFGKSADPDKIIISTTEINFVDSPLFVKDKDLTSTKVPSNDPLTSLPANFTVCSNENETCKTKGQSEVYYGKNNSFYKKTVENKEFKCDSNTFGNPLDGVVKACYIPTDKVPGPEKATSVPADFSLCSNENEKCNTSGQADVYYGKQNSYFKKTIQDKSFNCNNDTFGNPLGDIVKSCFVQNSKIVGPLKADNVPLNFSSCGSEGQQCKTTGPTEVYYGYGNRFFKKTINETQFNCSYTIFGDAYPGYPKSCYVANDKLPPKPLFPPHPSPDNNNFPQTINVKNNTGNVVGTATKVGCYADGGHRHLPDYIVSDGKHTPEICAGICKERGKPYSAMQYSSYCMCGTESDFLSGPTRMGAAPIAENNGNCRYTCPGDRSTRCGGGWVNVIYKLN